MTWSLAFFEDFHTLPPSWYVYSGQPGGEPFAWWEESHVSVKDSILNIRCAGPYILPNGNAGFISGGISCPVPQTYGKWEVRMRSDNAPGISTIALLWPADNVWNEGPEVDFREGYGDTSVATYHGPPQIQETMPTTDLTKWHVIGVEWTPGQLSYTLDNHVWGSVPSSPDVSMRLCLQSEYLGDETPPNHSDFQIDWVRQYAYA